MNTNKFPSFPNSSALGRGIRVKLTAGVLAVAGAGDDELGVLPEAVLATDTMASVIPNGTPGVVEFVAAVSITQYAQVFAAASGKIGVTATGLRRGIALEAASGDGSIIKVLVQGGSGPAV
jgi:hypothetical protein